MSDAIAPELHQARMVYDDAMFALNGGRYRIAVVFAYQAAFIAAQALIFAREGRRPKTHAGLHSRFAFITKDDAGLRPWAAWLADAADMRHASLYGESEDVEASAAEVVVEKAEAFLVLIDRLLTSP